MTRVDLHPEDLFDHLRRGELREDERERLQRHCAVCSACAFELHVVEGNAYDSEPTADDHVMAARALERMLSSDAAEEVVAVATTARGQLLPRAAALVLAGVLVGGSVSAAALANSDTAGWVTWIGSWVTWKAPTSTDDASAGAKLAPPRSARTRPATEARKDKQANVDTAVIDTAVSADVALAIEPAAAEPTVDVALAATSEATETPRTRTLARTTPASVRAATATSPTSPTVQDTTLAVPPVEPAAWLFRAASRARSEGRVHEAAALYDALQRDYADSEVGVVTRVVLGRLALSQLNDPGRALSAFDSYLLTRPNGALAEEARSGRVLALQKLGRDEEARSAAEELNRLHPRSLYRELESTAP